MNAALKTQPEHKAYSSEHGITEILMPYGEDMTLILPMLASLSHECKNQWFTMIVPRSFLMSDLKPYPFAFNNIRLVHSQHSDDSLWMSWDALSNGNSGYVVSFLEDLSDTDRSRLEGASFKGQTRGLVLRKRQA
ncbi:MAG: hypothetical protein K6L80_02165 [Agarilytica sp.]